MVIPRLVIAAPASGHGKTTVATGLLAAFVRAGRKVAPFKVGPDYIDPGYHGLAAGRPGRNLDPVLVGADLVAPLFAHGAAGSELAVVEGVMGLYDGRQNAGPTDGTGDFGSTAHVAALLSAPVVLVVDAAAQGRSVAALVHGFRSFGAVRFGGVILNRVGSDRHETLLREACEEVGAPVLGVLRRHAAVAAPARHLGLVPVVERQAEAIATVAALADLVTASVDLEAVLRVARSAPDLPVTPWRPYREHHPDRSGPAGSRMAGPGGQAGSPLAGPGWQAWPRMAGPGGQAGSQLAGSARPVGRAEPPVGGAPEPVAGGGPASGAGGPEHGPVVAVAGGPAFSFGYAETVEMLTAAGAQVRTVDPLRDEALPAGTRGLVVGGGFPEVYAAELAANAPLRAEVAALAARGGPIVAECAGLLWLCRTLDGAPMCGVLDADAIMTEKLTLGYRDAVALSDSVLAPAGTRVTGHEFHRTAVRPRFAGHGIAGRNAPVGAGTARRSVPDESAYGDAGALGGTAGRTASDGSPPGGAGAAGRTGGAGAAGGGGPAWAWRGAEPEGFVSGRVHASYLHLHWAGQPGIPERLVAACG